MKILEFSFKFIYLSLFDPNSLLCFFRTKSIGTLTIDSVNFNIDLSAENQQMVNLQQLFLINESDLIEEGNKEYQVRECISKKEV